MTQHAILSRSSYGIQIHAIPSVVGAFIVSLMVLVACAPGPQPSTGAAPPTGASNSPQSAPIAALQTQVANQQQQIAALQTAVAQPKVAPAPTAAPVPVPAKPPAAVPTKPPPAATSPTAAARLFFQALLARDVSGALARMSIAAQSTYSSTLPKLASSLAPCGQSVMEVTSIPNTKVAVKAEFTPPCGDIRTVFPIMIPGMKPGDYISGPVPHIIVTVQLVNEEWKVTEFSPF